MKLFRLFWTVAIITTFVTATNAYAVSTNDPYFKVPVTVAEMENFFGLILLFGVIKVPERRSAWEINSIFYNINVAKVMTRHRFEAILRNLHWFNTASISKDEVKQRNFVDPFWRMADLLETLAVIFRTLYIPFQETDVDEQGIPSKAYHHAVQYNKDKPEKWFFKVYALNCARSSYMCNFYLFRGKDKCREEGVPASAYPVWKLLQHDIYRGWNYICFIDNYFNGMWLCKKLRTIQVETCGTCRTNRVPLEKGCPKWYYPKTGKLKGKKGEMKCSTLDDGANPPLYVTSWMDKKAVNMLHTFPTYKVSINRNERNAATGIWEKAPLAIPSIITNYNKGMGGTDLFDQFLSYYRTSVKTKRWPHRIYFHFLMCCVVNSWIIYKFFFAPNKHEKYGSLLTYLLEIIEGLTDTSKVDHPYREAPEARPLMAPKHRKTEETNAKLAKVRGPHWPYSLPQMTTNRRGDVIPNRKTCKNIGCNSKVATFCSTCGVALCLNLRIDPITKSQTNCFMEYHAT